MSERDGVLRRKQVLLRGQFRTRTRPAQPFIQRDGRKREPVAIASEPLRIVLTALVRNAVEAMPAGGTVTVVGRSVHLDDSPTSTLPTELAPGRYAQVTVADTGSGFRPDVLRLVAEEPKLELASTTEEDPKALPALLAFARACIEHVA